MNGWLWLVGGGEEREGVGRVRGGDAGKRREGGREEGDRGGGRAGEGVTRRMEHT